MKLNRKKRKEIADKIQRHIPSSCPVCRSSDFSIMDSIMELREYNRGKMIIGPGQNLVPYIILNCQNCGYSMFFNAVNLGLISVETGDWIKK